MFKIKIHKSEIAPSSFCYGFKVYKEESDPEFRDYSEDVLHEQRDLFHEDLELYFYLSEGYGLDELEPMDEFTEEVIETLKEIEKKEQEEIQNQ